MLLMLARYCVVFEVVQALALKVGPTQRMCHPHILALTGRNNIAIHLWLKSQLRRLLFSMMHKQVIHDTSSLETHLILLGWVQLSVEYPDAVLSCRKLPLRP